MILFTPQQLEYIEYAIYTGDNPEGRSQNPDMLRPLQEVRAWRSGELTEYPDE